MTRRKSGEYWTEVKRVLVDDTGEPYVKQTTCCCAQPGAGRRECSDQREHPIKTACRCHCHKVVADRMDYGHPCGAAK